MNFSHNTTLPLFVTIHTNFYNLVAVLPEVIHTLNIKLVFRTIVDLVSNNDDSD